MRIGVWNIDHPATSSKGFLPICEHLLRLDCEHLVLTETNAALQLPGYSAVFSSPSPYLRRGRDYRSPNEYRQVGIYSKRSLRKLPQVEDVNGVFAKIEDNAPLYLYGSVFTIKDRWAAWSDKTYTDRVNEQCAIIGEQARARMIVCGDFNFRGRGHYNKGGRLKLERIVEVTSLVWPTRQETRTVQHLLHAPDLQTVGYEVLKTTLSDHPVLTFELD